MREIYLEIPALEVDEEETQYHRIAVNRDGFLVCLDCGLVLGRVYVLQGRVKGKRFSF